MDAVEVALRKRAQRHDRRCPAIRLGIGMNPLVGGDHIDGTLASFIEPPSPDQKTLALRLHDGVPHHVASPVLQLGVGVDLDLRDLLHAVEAIEPQPVDRAGTVGKQELGAAEIILARRQQREKARQRQSGQPVAPCGAALAASERHVMHVAGFDPAGSDRSVYVGMREAVVAFVEGRLGKDLADPGFELARRCIQHFGSKSRKRRSRPAALTRVSRFGGDCNIAVDLGRRTEIASP